MTIKIGTFVLCDGADPATGKLCGPSGLSGGRRPQSQISYPIGATNARVFPRGGHIYSYSWSSTVRLESNAAAIAWLETFDATCPGGGILYFGATAKGSGSLSYTWDPIVGCSVTLRFTAEVAR